MEASHLSTELEQISLWQISSVLQVDLYTLITWRLFISGFLITQVNLTLVEYTAVVNNY